MIGLFMVSQSGLIAQGLMELISHTAPDIPVMAVGGNPYGGQGVDLERIYGALEDLCSPKGAIVLYDTEDSYRDVMEAAADLGFKGIRNITAVPAALLEDALTASRYIESGISLQKVSEVLEGLKLPEV